MSDSKVFYGKVIWFSAAKGFGFIEWQIDEVKQKDIFAHFSDINIEGFKTLYKEQQVSFELGTNKHGVPKAINIAVLRH